MVVEYEKIGRSSLSKRQSLPASSKPHTPRPLHPGRKSRSGSAPPGPPGTVLVRAGHPGNSKPAAPRLRHAWAGAPRRELSKSVEFLKIGSLHQMLWLRDAEWVYRVHCDTRVNALYQSLGIVRQGIPPHTYVRVRPLQGLGILLYLELGPTR